MQGIIDSLRIRVLFIIFLFILSVSLLDSLIFSHLLYLFPNELEWDTSYWYNFQHSRKKTSHSGNKEILITGSSVALYSVLPSNLENKLNNTGVNFYSHVAMSPTDFYYYTDDLISKKPHLIVYALNPADFQLDFFDVNKDSNLYDTDRWIREGVQRQPVRSFYPFKYFLDYNQYLSREPFFLLLSKSILYVNRERNFILDPLWAYYERHLRGGRSYHNYTGIIPEEGIWRKGWTLPASNFACEVPDLGVRKDMIYVQIPQTKVTITSGSDILFSEIFSKPGWKEISFVLNSKEKTQNINLVSDKVVSSRVIDPKNYSREEFYGVRLSQNFCRNTFEEDIAYDRREVLEDIVLSNMTNEEYSEDYFNKLYKNVEKRPELYRQLHIRNIKKWIYGKEFLPWVEFQNLEKALKKLSENNIKVLLVNAPENPIETVKYIPSKWYNGFNQYMLNLNTKNIKYVDRILFIQDPRYFIDVNHLTYKGAELMTAEYLKLIKEYLNE